MQQFILPSDCELQNYIISLSLNIVEPEMQKNQQYQYFSNILSNRTPEVDTQAFQRGLSNWLARQKVSLATLSVIYKGIFAYGFGFLFSIKAHYESEHFKLTALSLKNQLSMIQVLILRIFGNFGFENFIGLEFLKQCPSQEIRKLRKMQRKLQYGLNLSKQLQQKSVIFMRHAINLKRAIKCIDQLTTNNIMNLKNIYKNIKLECSKAKSYNYFEKEYHLFILGTILDAFERAKVRCASDKNTIEKIDKAIAEMFEVDNLFNVFQKSQKSQFQARWLSIQQQLIPYKKQNEIDVVVVKQEQVYSNQSDLSATTNLNHNKFKKRSNSVYSRLLIVDNRQKSPEIFTPKNANQQKLKKKTLPNFLCCRKFFYVDQLIEQAESLRRQYKFYTYPFDGRNQFILCKTIVAFLNCQGGIIYLGIKEQENKMRKAIGIELNEQTKEQLLKCIRKICQKVEPDIVSSTMYQVKFVPMKASKDNRYVYKKYIVKIIVQMGKAKQLYFSRTKDEGIKVAFRTENEVLVKDPSYDLGKIIEVVKNRLLDPPRVAGIDHEGPCHEPDIGLSCYY